jgi:hypothetical protein
LFLLFYSSFFSLRICSFLLFLLFFFFFSFSFCF